MIDADVAARGGKVRPTPIVELGPDPAVGSAAAGEGSDTGKLKPTPTVPVGPAEPEGAGVGRTNVIPSAAASPAGVAAPPLLTASATDGGAGAGEPAAAVPGEASVPVAPEPPVGAPIPAAEAEPAAAVAEPEPAITAELETTVVVAEPAPVAVAEAPAEPPAAEARPVEPVPAQRGSVPDRGAPPEGSLAPSSVPPARPGAKRSRWVVVAVAGAAALAVAVGIWFATAGAPELAPEAVAEDPAAETRGAAKPAISEARPTEQASAAPSAEAAPAEPEPVASPSASAEAVAGEPETLRVRILVTPPTGRIVEKGKKVGHSGVEVEVAPGKRRVFEIQHDGYTARRLVVDGSEPEIHIGLRPSSGAQATPPPGGQSGSAAPPPPATPTSPLPAAP